MSASYKGFLCLVLHAHLPYIRHPEHEYFLEENWLYEAITETYIPLINLLSRLADDKVDFRITLSLSPSVIEMLNDDFLMERYKRHIGNLIEISEREIYRTKGDIHLEPVVRMYRERFLNVRYIFEDVHKGNLVSAFQKLQDTGNIEIITSAATHAFLPNLSLYPQAVRAQIKTGSGYHKKIFGRTSKGIWLPECGFVPGSDNYIREEGIRYFFLDTHGIIHGKPMPRYGVYAPVQCPSGVAAFGRDIETSRQVWSSVEGYPGDFDYRDFYRDTGFDSESEHIKAYVHLFGARTYTGFKYYRITGKTDHKQPYVLQRAMEKAHEHAENFILNRENQIDYLSNTLGIRPLIVSTYDAELFGHWWFEGIEWLDFLLRGICRDKRNFRTITPSEFLDSDEYHPEGLQTCEPSMSSWGDKGYNEVWLNSSNDYIYPHLLKATGRMIYLAGRFPLADGIHQRALNQAAREILLSQLSDWTFALKNNTAAEYARNRLKKHISRFNTFYQAILSDNISEKWLAAIEDEDRIFTDLDYRVFGSKE